MSELHAVRRAEHKRTDKGERRENENKWQAGSGVMHNSYIKCSSIV